MFGQLNPPQSKEPRALPVSLSLTHTHSDAHSLACCSLLVSLFSLADPTDELMQEEIFGPLLPVREFGSIDEVQTF